MRKTGRLLVVTATLLFTLVAVAIAAPPAIEGTYKLKSRTLADGTVIGEEALHGVLSLSGGLSNFNVGWADPSGKHFSYSKISTYTLTETDYTETVLFSIMNDEIGVMADGKPTNGPVYTMNETKTVPIAVDGSKTTINMPFDPPTLVFDGDKMVGTIEGVFVDTWAKVK